MGTVPALAVLAAIAVATPFDTPLEHSARIYVYAQRLTSARSWLRIECGGVAVAELKQGMFFAIDLPPGRHLLTTETGAPALFDVHAGEEAFVRLDWDYASDRPPVPVLSAVSPDKARTEMRYLSYINAKRVLSSSVPKTDPREPAQLRLKRRDGQ